MVLEIWKKREWGWRSRWGVLFLWCLLCLRCSPLGAVEVMEASQGKVLIWTQPPETGVEKIAESGLRDPFNWSHEFIGQYQVRKRSKEDLFVGLHLSGIVWNLQAPLAIINKVLLKEGEMVENAMVLKIFKDSVLLAREGAQHTLHFQQRIIDLGTESARKDKGSEERK